MRLKTTKYKREQLCNGAIRLTKWSHLYKHHRRKAVIQGYLELNIYRHVTRRFKTHIKVPPIVLFYLTPLQQLNDKTQLPCQTIYRAFFIFTVN